MTIFGPDISSYEAGLDLSRLTDAAFVLAKVTEGTYYTDADFPGWRAQAARISKPLFWYHFLSGENATAQADHTAAALGPTALPGMLDCEPEGKFSPTLAQIVAYVRAAHAVGLNLRLVYLPHWYWEQMGSPDLSELAALGVHLVSSAYPGGSGTAAQLYPGDGAAGWNSYGGMTPLLYQFTDKASDGGQQVDFNAFRGSIGQLAAYLTDPTTNPGGSTVPNIPPSIAQDIPDVAKDFPPNGPYSDDTAIIWADARAAAAMLYARQARDAIIAFAAKQSGQPVDVAALAAQLGPLLHPTTDVNALVAALAPHVGAPDPAAFAAALAPHIKVTSA